MTARTGRPVPSPTPNAVATVPSIPARPRFAITGTGESARATRSTSRTTVEEPTTSTEPSRQLASHTARATCSRVSCSWPSA